MEAAVAAASLVVRISQLEEVSLEAALEEEAAEACSLEVDPVAEEACLVAKEPVVEEEEDSSVEETLEGCSQDRRPEACSEANNQEEDCFQEVLEVKEAIRSPCKKHNSFWL